MQPLQFRLLVNFHRQSFLIRRLRRVSRQFAILAFIKTVLLIKSLLTFNGNGKEKQILLNKFSFKSRDQNIAWETVEQI